MPIGPGGGPTITVEALLKQPGLLVRNLTNITTKRFIADQVFARGSADQVRGGAALYQKSENIYPDRAAQEVQVRSRWPRTGWTEAVFTAMVHVYGLEVPISDLARRRNQLDYIERSQIKLGNALVKFVDTIAMATLTGEASKLTDTASGDWTTAATDIIKDIATWRAAIANQEEGYVADTLIVNPAQELDLMIDTDIRNALPRESTAPNPVLTGRPAPILGLDNILTTPQLAAGTVIVVNSKVVGTIADEQPEGFEGYVTRQQGGNYAPIYVKVYREEGADETLVRGARFPAMWVSEPKALLVATGA